MPYFVKCKVPSIEYLRGETITNYPLNLDLCSSISKFTQRWYPDNTGKPAIIFKGNDLTWVYNNVEDRDAEFETLSNIQIASNRSL